MSVVLPFQSCIQSSIVLSRTTVNLNVTVVLKPSAVLMLNEMSPVCKPVGSSVMLTRLVKPSEDTVVVYFMAVLLMPLRIIENFTCLSPRYTFTSVYARLNCAELTAPLKSALMTHETGESDTVYASFTDVSVIIPFAIVAISYLSVSEE